MQLQPKSLSEDDQIGSMARTLNGIGQAILILDKSGRIVFINDHAERQYGWKKWALVSRDIGEVITVPVFTDFSDKYLQHLEQGESWSGNFLVKRGDGTSVWSDISVAKFAGELQNLISLTSTPIVHISTLELSQVNQILAKIDLMLGDGQEFKTKLVDLAQLLIPSIADWCGIYLIQDDGTNELVAVAPAEISERQAVYDWLHNDLPNDDVDGLPEVLHAGESKLVPEVSPVRRAAEAGIRAYMIVPLTTHHGTQGAIALIGVDPTRHFDRNTLAIAENLAKHIAVFLEMAQQHIDSQEMNLELEQRVNERTAELREAVAQLKQSDEILQAIFRISNKLNATLDVELILDELAQEAIKVVDGESGFAGLRTAEGMTVHKYFQDGVAIPFEHTWASGEGIPGWVLKYKVPYGTSDAANDPLISHELAINANIRSIICTPILDTVGEVIGYFDIRNKHGAEGFTISDQEMLLTLAPVASIAIQNAIAYQQRMAKVAELKESARQLQDLAASLESAREEERTQIARELHDQLSQSLTAMKFDLAWLTEQLSKKDEELAQKAKDITAQMNNLIKTVRRIATELRPGMLDDLGLIASIEWQAHDFEKRTGIECKVNANLEDMTLTRDQNLTLYRIVQEALTNVARYANAKHIEVKLTAAGELLTLEINDDGQGIREEEITGMHSLGLIGMRERAKYLGGTFNIQGVPDQGTTLRVSIPSKQNG